MSDQPIEPKVEPQAAQPIPTPEAEPVEGEKFDAARAMALIEKLRGEIKELKVKAKKADELTEAEQKRKEAEMTELQKKQAELDKINAELKALRLTEMRRAAAVKTGLPLAFAERLKGETPEELEADAKLLLEALPKAPQTPKIEPTSPGPGAGVGETIAQRRARIYGSNVDPLDPNYAKAHGGGVLWPEKTLTPK